jgi:phosphotransferase system enzyme I (PtsP)
MMKTDVFTELLRNSLDIQDFLKRALGWLIERLGSDAGSIYLYDESEKRLVLRATQGFDKNLVGKLSLSLNEGLVGLTLREQRTVKEARGRDHPDFLVVPELKEEDYKAFVSVPIYRGTTPVGVIALQNRRDARFSDEDVKSLRELGSGLSSAMENAQLLLEIHEIHPEHPLEPDQASTLQSGILRGRGASEGIALGKAVLLGTSEVYLSEPNPEHYSVTLKAFQQALKCSIDQVEELQKDMEIRLADVASLIFSTHILMLKDESFSGEMVQLIQNGMSAPSAVVSVVNRYIGLFHQSANNRLKEKVQDVKDLGHRLLANLNRGSHDDGDYIGQIVVAQELLPSELIKITAQHAEGLLLFGGGASAHVSILARSLGIPVVFTEDKALFSIRQDDDLILDGFQGNAFIRPVATVWEHYQNLRQQYRESDLNEVKVSKTTRTKDGRDVHLYANVNLVSDLPLTKKYKAEGIGLYRSEFPFLIRNDFPTEEEQFRIYKKILDEMDGKEVLLRTLDIGGDKVLSYLPQSSESNPFLGLRALRFSLKNKSIFHHQLRAMLRAGEGHALHIMFPLVSSLDDFREAKGHVVDCIRQLNHEGTAHNDHPLIGSMIELPSACEVSSELAKECDFLCIGTNDLVQYLLGVDRTNEAVSSLYTAYHPAVLRTLARVIRAALNHDCPISVCGEIAADPKMIPFFLGAGIRKLSVTPKLIPEVQKLVSELSWRECQVTAEKLVNLGTVEEIRRYLDQQVSS